MPHDFTPLDAAHADVGSVIQGATCYYLLTVTTRPRAASIQVNRSHGDDAPSLDARMAAVRSLAARLDSLTMDPTWVAFDDLATQAGNYTAIGRVGDTEVSVWTSVSHAEAQLTFADGAR